MSNAINTAQRPYSVFTLNLTEEALDFINLT